MSDDQTAEIKPRKVGFLLGAGIFFLPIVFAWFTLRKGHSKLARVLSLGWLGLGVAFWVLAAIGSNNEAPTDEASADQIAADDQAAAAEDVLHEQVAAEEAVAEQAAEEAANRSAETTLVALRARMRHHARCYLATEFAPGFMDSLAQGVPDGPRDIAYKQSMRVLKEYHLNEIRAILLEARGQPYANDLAAYGDQVQEDIKIAARQDPELRLLELANLGNSQECKQ